MNLEIKRHSDDLKRGDLVYHGHELLLVSFVGKWHTEKDGRVSRRYRFRRVGRINLDHQWKALSAAPERGKDGKS